MVSLRYLSDLMDSHPELQTVHIEQLTLFYRLCCAEKKDILLPQRATHGVGTPPEELPPSIEHFLVGACNLRPIQVHLCWVLLRESIWAHPELCPEILHKLYLHYGHPVGVTYKTLYPPSDFCHSPDCAHYRLPLKKVEQTQAALFTVGQGVLPIWTARTYCKGCNTAYYHNYCVKGKERIYYRDVIPDYVQIGQHHYAERQLVDTWIAQMRRNWTSATGSADVYNETSQHRNNWDPSWKPSPKVRTDHVWDGFVVLSLLEDCKREGTILRVPDGAQRDRFTAAMQARNARISHVGQAERFHFCDRCTRWHQPNAAGPVKTSMIVIDGVCVGRPCCAYLDKDSTPCTVPLHNNINRFCPLHQSYETICSVDECDRPVRPGTKSCDDPLHMATEERHLQTGAAAPRLRAALRAQKAAHPNSFPSVHAEADDGMHDDFGDSVPHEQEFHVMSDGTFTGLDQEGKPKEGHKKIKAKFEHRTTHNEQLFVACCGMIVARETFFHAETPSAVLEMIERVYPDPRTRPNHICYDNACTLSSMIKGLAKWLGIAWTVDVFHFFCKHSKKHVWCQNNCNPTAFRELQNKDPQSKSNWWFNTSVAEQTNNWFGKFHPMCSKMRADKYTFFLDEMVLRHNALLKQDLQRDGACPGYWRAEFFA